MEPSSILLQIKLKDIHLVGSAAPDVADGDTNQRVVAVARLVNNVAAYTKALLRRPVNPKL